MASNNSMQPTAPASESGLPRQNRAIWQRQLRRAIPSWNLRVTGSPNEFLTCWALSCAYERLASRRQAVVGDSGHGVRGMERRLGIVALARRSPGVGQPGFGLRADFGAVCAVVARLAVDIGDVGCGGRIQLAIRSTASHLGHRSAPAHAAARVDGRSQCRSRVVGRAAAPAGLGARSCRLTLGAIAPVG
jgi:hypothetical protein